MHDMMCIYEVVHYACLCNNVCHMYNMQLSNHLIYMTVQLTVQVTLISSCVELWEASWAVTVKAAGSIEQRKLDI